MSTEDFPWSITKFGTEETQFQSRARGPKQLHKDQTKTPRMSLGLQLVGQELIGLIRGIGSI